MATILLSAAGAAIGGSIGGTVFGLSTAVIGRAIGATLGNIIDQRLLGGGSEVVETGRIERFRLSGASEGTAIGTLYGRLRIGGQVIWSTRFLEHVETEKSGGGGKGGGGGTTVTTKTYSYTVSLAIALCEGPILGIDRIWADGMEINRDQLDLRVYRGGEDQLPDPKIQAVEGARNAPAYRGLAYVVIENLDLTRFGNRVPQFSFEVLRATDPNLVPENERSLAHTIRGVAMIPGTGEYALATTKVNYTNGFSWRDPANVHSGSGKSDFATSLGQLRTELPRCSSVSLVVSWFGDDLRCGACNIVPKVEQQKYDGDRMSWRVSGVTRGAAQTVPRIDDRPVYGGTPSDQSVIEAIQALRAAGRSVVFYPFLLMDQLEGNSLVDPWSGGIGQPEFPWRGRITVDRAPGVPGSSDGTFAATGEVKAFFGSAGPGDFQLASTSVSYAGTSEWSFRRFILHNAYLCALAGGVDAFCIGSEMRGLTQIRGAGNNFPAVDELVSLARDVRAILGPTTKIGYAADWSEYFGYHPQDGSGDVFFHLDPLWASPDIDFVGIDNYMPLSDWRDFEGHADSEWGSVHDLNYLKSNIAGGEGYDWYYADFAGRSLQERLPITDGAYDEPWVFRYKDIRNWWSQRHHERIGGVRQASPTAWVPESKPIWFTEIGCAAIDKGTNQPNKFVDPKSSESGVPWFSTGMRDDLIQLQYLRATYQYWSDAANNPVSGIYGGSMVDVARAHVWAWDARPYPSFPARTAVWSDGGNYYKGHWLNGRASSESLAAVVAEICGRAGVRTVDVSKLYGLVRGYAIDEVSGARTSLQPLSIAYGFDASERQGALSFRSRSSAVLHHIEEGEQLAGDDPTLTLQHGSATDNAGIIRVNYIQAGGDYETRTSEAGFPDDAETGVLGSDLPISLTNVEGRQIAERWLAEARIARDTASFGLPPSRSDIFAGDVVSLKQGNTTGTYRIDRVETDHGHRIDAVRVENAVFVPAEEIGTVVTTNPPAVAVPVFAHMLDLPLIAENDDPVAPYVAATIDPWPGVVAVYSSAEDDGYSFNCQIDAPAIIGVTETALPAAMPGLPDLGPALRVRIGGGSLSSTTRTGLLNGANALAIGDGVGGEWELMQFGEATLVDTDTYDLSFRLRGQLGTDATMPAEWPAGSIVVFLDGAPRQIDLPSSARGLLRHYRIGPAELGYGDETYEHVEHIATGAGLRPYSPVHLRAARHASGELVVNWIRRSRVDGNTWEGLDIPLGEETEAYLVQIVVDGETRRAVQVGASSWTYAAGTQLEDSITGPFTVRVAQISERYGAGPFQRIEIDE